MVQTLAPGADVGDVVQNLLDRVSQLEQRITNPSYTVPNGSSPVFGAVGVGGGGGVVLSTAVSPPTGLAATSGADFERVYIHATWTGPFDTSAASYQVMVAKKDQVTGIYTLSNIYMVNGLEAYIYNIDPNAVYGLKVYSVSRVGSVSIPDPSSGWIDVTTVVDTTIPAAPSGLAGAAGIASVTVWWNDNTEVDVKQGRGIYELQYSLSSSFTSPTTQKVAGTVVTYTDLSPATTYYFRVRVYDTSGNVSAWSSTLTLVPGTVGAASSDGLAPSSSPTPTLVSAVGGLMVQFTMINNPDPVIYEIHISTTTGFTPSGATKVATSGSSNVMLFKDASGTALAYGTTYYVKIVATDADGAAPASAQASGTTRQATTSDIAVGSITAASGIIASLDASTITTGTLSGSFITAGTITAAKLVAGTITAASGVIGSIDASVITTGTLNATRIGTGTISANTITLSSTGTIQGGTNPGGSGGAQSGWILNGTGFTAVNSGVIKFQIDVNGNATFSGTLSATTLVSPTISGGTITGTSFATATSGGNRVTIDPSNQIQLWTSYPYPGQIAAFTTLPGALYLYAPSNTGAQQGGLGIISGNIFSFYGQGTPSTRPLFATAWTGGQWLVNYYDTASAFAPLTIVASATHLQYVDVVGSFTVFTGATIGGTLTAGNLSTTGTLYAGSSATLGSVSTGTINCSYIANTGILSVGGGSSFYGSVYFLGLSSFAGGTVTINTSTGQVGYVVSSRRFKKNIEPLSVADLRPMLDIPVNRFEYRGDPGTKHLGPMAEDVAAATPELAIFDELDRPSSIYGYQAAWLWIPFVKDLLARVEALEAA